MKVEKGRKSDISVLCEELLVEIFCRLGSVKYATQCRSVCKVWCPLINSTSSLWLYRWYRTNPKTESITLVAQYGSNALIVSKETSTVGANLRFLPCFNDKNPVHVLGSYKDLLLCCPNNSDHSRYYICNPFTKQWTALPPPPGRCQPTAEERAQVEFIVEECANGALKFMVVRIFRYIVLPFRSLHDEKVQVSVFSSEGGWRVMDDNGKWREMFRAYRSCKSIIPYKGRLVCLINETIFSGKVRLYSWDLHSNYARLPLIPGNRFITMSTIGVCEGLLQVAQMLDDYRQLIVWQFDDSQSQDWHRLHELELDFPQLLGPEFGQGFKINTRAMTFHPHDRDILYLLVNIMSGDK